MSLDNLYWIRRHQSLIMKPRYEKKKKYSVASKKTQLWHLLLRRTLVLLSINHLSK